LQPSRSAGYARLAETTVAATPAPDIESGARALGEKIVREKGETLFQ
jgi:hypothetical protein